MSVGTSAAIVCREAMDPGEYDAVAGELSRAGRVVIDIDLRQMGEMAGNALEVTDGKGARTRCACPRAWESLGRGAEGWRCGDTGRTCTPSPYPP